MANGVFTEDSQFLYNYRVMGKVWRLPRAALLINRSGKHKLGANAGGGSDVTAAKEPIYEDPHTLRSELSPQRGGGGGGGGGTLRGSTLESEGKIFADTEAQLQFAQNYMLSSRQRGHERHG